MDRSLGRLPGPIAPRRHRGPYRTARLPAILGPRPLKRARTNCFNPLTTFNVAENRSLSSLSNNCSCILQSLSIGPVFGRPPEQIRHVGQVVEILAIRAPFAQDLQIIRPIHRVDELLTERCVANSTQRVRADREAELPPTDFPSRSRLRPAIPGGMPQVEFAMQRSVKPLPIPQ